MLAKLWYYAHFLVWVLLIMISGQIGFWASDNDHPMKESDGVAINSPLNWGAPNLVIERHTVFDRECAGRIRRSIVQYFPESAEEGYVTELDMDRETNVVPAGERTFLVNIPMSRSIRPGHYIYKVRQESMCNPWQKILGLPMVAYAEDVFFTIVTPTGK